MRLHTHPHHIGRVLAATGVAMIGIAMMGPVSADPPGNNGTIKIDGVDFDTRPDNEPHVSCTFQVDFYGYEALVPVTMVFSVQPPTGDDQVIRTVTGVLDNDDSSGANAGGIDGNFTIDLTTNLASFTPHPNQGYHVKLHITAIDGTPQGSTGKSKVFWVGPCQPPPTTTTTGSTTTTTGGTTTTVGGGTTTTTLTGATVGGVVVTRPPTTTTAAAATTATTKPTQVLGVQLPRTGLSDVFLMAGLTALSLGLVFEALAQMAKRRSTIS